MLLLSLVLLPPPLHPSIPPTSPETRPSLPPLPESFLLPPSQMLPVSLPMLPEPPVPPPPAQHLPMLPPSLELPPAMLLLPEPGLVRDLYAPCKLRCHVLSHLLLCLAHSSLVCTGPGRLLPRVTGPVTSVAAPPLLSTLPPEVPP